MERERSTKDTERQEERETEMKRGGVVREEVRTPDERGREKHREGRQIKTIDEDGDTSSQKDSEVNKTGKGDIE